MGDRRSMQFGDWINAAALLAVGVFLGLAIEGLVQLIGSPFLPQALLTVLLFAGVFLLYLALDALVERVFNTGVKPARLARKKERKPLALLLSLPAGLVIGVIGAQFGLRGLLL